MDRNAPMQSLNLISCTLGREKTESNCLANFPRTISQTSSLFRQSQHKRKIRDKNNRYCRQMYSSDMYQEVCFNQVTGVNVGHSLAPRHFMLATGLSRSSPSSSSSCLFLTASFLGYETVLRSFFCSSVLLKFIYLFTIQVFHSILSILDRSRKKKNKPTNKQRKTKVTKMALMSAK